MAKLTLSNPSTIANESAFLTLTSNNYDLIEAAIENTISRDGTAPNSMAANLDMNSYRVMNLPLPENDAEPVRLGEFEAFETEFDAGIAALNTSVAAAQLAETNAELAEVNAELAEVAAEAAQVAAEAAQAAAEAAASSADVAVHIADPTAAHAASAISNTPAGTIAATNVQTALNELDTDKLAASAYTAADVLSKLLTVDGAGSGLDADLLDGNSSAAFALASHTHTQSEITDLAASLTTARVQRADATGFLELTGDDAADQGANLRLYGASHATKAGDFDLRVGTSVVIQWDESASFLTIADDTEFNGGVYIGERAAARPDETGSGQFWVENLTPNIPKFTDDVGSDFSLGMLQKAQTWSAVQTFTDPVITGTILEDVYTITDGAGFEIDPGNGSIQLITLGASRTPAATNFAAGESVTLMIADGSAFTITWTTVAVTWVGGAAPTLATSGYTVVELWKVGSTIYGAHVGDVA